MKQTTRTRLWVGYNITAFPLVVFCIFMLWLTIAMWDLRGIGPVEGPEPSVKQEVVFSGCQFVFVLEYVILLFIHRRSPVILSDWVKFGCPIPPLFGMIAVVMGLPTMSLLEKIIISVYPLLLIGLLSVGLGGSGPSSRRGLNSTNNRFL